MSKWPEGFDVAVYNTMEKWFVSIHDLRPLDGVVHLPGYTTRQEAEGAAIDWIQRRIGVPETVPQPVLAKHDDYSLITSESHVKYLLERLADLDAWFPRPVQDDFDDDKQHTAAADCWQYRCGLIEALRQSLQAERDLIREKL